MGFQYLIKEQLKRQASKQNIENKVHSIFPNSPAEKGGLSVGDEIVIINGLKISDDLSQWLEYFNLKKSLV